MNLYSFQGNWVDLVIIIFVLFYLWEGWGRGFWTTGVELIAFLISLAAALRLYIFPAGLLRIYFSIPLGLSNALGFIASALIIEQLLLAGVSGLAYKLDTPRGNKRLISLFIFIPLLGKAVLLLVFWLAFLTALPIRGSVKAAITGSIIGGHLLDRSYDTEKQISAIFGPAAEETLNFLTVNTGSKESVNLHFRQEQVVPEAQTEEQMLGLVNQERLSAGLVPLKADDKLRQLARDYGTDMFRRGYFSHYNPEGQSPFDRMKVAGIKFAAAGENLALAPNLNLAHTGLMDSPGHRENILSPEFTRVGIGVMDGGIYGKMFVQEFAD